MMHELSAENRQYPRTACDATVAAQRIPQHGPNNASWLLAEDISEGGMQLSSPECVPVGSRLLMSLEEDLASEPIRAIGTVVWVAQAPYQDRWSVGVEFSELAENDRMRLQRLASHHA